MSEAAYTAIRSTWKSMVDLALEHKKEFQTDADECMRFFNGPYDFLYGLKELPQRGDFVYTGLKRMPRPSIAMTVNKVAEGVQLFGPTLYHKNPICKVNPRKPPDIPFGMFGDPKDPQVQAMIQPILMQLNHGRDIDQIRAVLLQSYLNYLPEAIGLKENMRQTIDEGLIKGMGVLWHEVYRPVGSPHRLVGSFYDSVDNLVIDPDQESIEHAKWVGRRICKPVWEVELEYGLPPGTLKGNYESYSQVAAMQSIGNEYKKKTGKTNDLLVYWKIWSKMGLGGLLRGITKDAAQVDQYGRYVQLVFCENYNFLLNLPPSIWGNQQECYRRCQWETPFWADDAWPFDYLDFHKVPRNVWPMSHFRPAMGELKFINWAYSFLASRMQKTSRTFIGILKAASDDFKTKILEGTDLELIELESSLGKSINEIVQFLDHPEVHGDFIKIIEMVEKNFERRTGLNELMYGESARQYRSAEEASVKQANLNIRPDDMANRVEDFATRVFRKMAMMARWHCDGNDLAPVFGPVIANLWQVHVATANLPEIVHQLEYRIEENSAKKPNTEKMSADADLLMQSLFPMLSQFATQTGQVGQFNALMKFWAESKQIDVAEMLLPEPPPPQPPAPEPPKVSIGLKGEDIITLGLDEAIRGDFGLKGPAPDGGHPVAQQMIQDEATHQQESRHVDELHKLKMKHEKEKAAAAKKKAATTSNGAK